MPLGPGSPPPPPPPPPDPHPTPTPTPHPPPPPPPPPPPHTHRHDGQRVGEVGHVAQQHPALVQRLVHQLVLPVVQLLEGLQRRRGGSGAVSGGGARREAGRVVSRGVGGQEADGEAAAGSRNIPSSCTSIQHQATNARLPTPPATGTAPFRGSARRRAPAWLTGCWCRRQSPRAPPARCAGRCREHRGRRGCGGGREGRQAGEYPSVSNGGWRGPRPSAHRVTASTAHPVPVAPPAAARQVVHSSAGCSSRNPRRRPTLPPAPPRQLRARRPTTGSWAPGMHLR